MKIMKLNEWKCGISIDDVDDYVEPTGALKDMIDSFRLVFNPRTGSYDCDGDVNLYKYYYDLSATEQMEFDDSFVRNGKMTIKFGEVKGNLLLPGDEYDLYKLTSLEGCPEKVGGDFYCYYNQLTSLKGCPKTVGGNFYCHNNKLASLKGCPETVVGHFDCRYNQLKSLEGCPETVGGDFWCGCNQLTSLKSCPEKVGGDFNCNDNQLTSLEGCPKSVGGYFSCINNKAQFTKNDVTAVCNVKGNIYVIL